MLKKDLKVNFKYKKQPIKVVVRPETYKVSQVLKTEYAVAFRRAIQVGVATRASMAELLKKEGIWSEVDEEKLLQRTIEISMLEVQLDQAQAEGLDDVAKQIAFKAVNLRSKIYELVQIKHLPMEHTAEAIAEDVRLDNFVTMCTFHADTGKPYFKDHNDFLARREDADAEKIYAAVIEELSRDNIDLLRKLPENKWLLDNKLIDKNGSAITDEVVKLLETEQELEVVLEEDKTD
jgi:hypothetical protein